MHSIGITDCLSATAFALASFGFRLATYVYSPLIFLSTRAAVEVKNEQKVRTLARGGRSLVVPVQYVCTYASCDWQLVQLRHQIEDSIGTEAERCMRGNETRVMPSGTFS